MKRVLKEERLMDTVDPVIKEGASKLELETMQALGFLAGSCLDEKRHNRPSMKEVAKAVVTSLNPNLKKYGLSNCMNFSLFQLSSNFIP